MSKIYIQNAESVLSYSGSLAASGGTSSSTSGSIVCSVYSRLIVGLISNASSIAGSGLRIRQSFDGGLNWDLISASDQVAACTAYSTEVNIRGNAVMVEYRNAGTAARFLSAFLTLGNGEYILDGEPRMRERPIGDPVDSLTQLGAKLEPTNNCPPVVRAGRAPPS